MTNVIVDYGCGNPLSIRNMLKKIGHASTISGDPDEIARAGRLILPGVGAFDFGMENLHRRGLIPALERRVLGEKAPILGICLGAQLFGRGSEEGAAAGLGWIDAACVRFDPLRIGPAGKIPHMGWADVEPRNDSALFTQAEPRFYFVHSYHLVCGNKADIAATARHGYEFTAAVRTDNIVGVQFHPEKSHRYGMALLSAFMDRFAAAA